MHRLLAMDFARWLDPHFAVWCDSKILELLEKGFTSVTNEELDIERQYSRDLEVELDESIAHRAILIKKNNIFNSIMNTENSESMGWGQVAGMLRVRRKNEN